MRLSKAYVVVSDCLVYMMYLAYLCQAIKATCNAIIPPYPYTSMFIIARMRGF